MFTPHIRRKEEGNAEKERKRKKGRKKETRKGRREGRRPEASQLPKGMDMPISLIMLLIS